MRMFTESPPLLLPVLDVAEIFSEDGLRRIDAARTRVRLKFPQFRWAVCTVNLPPDTSLSLFGFWLMNACPRRESETPEARAWTILLLMDVTSRKAATIPGYGAEPFLDDSDWTAAMARVSGPWLAGNPATAVTAFLNASHDRLESAWKRHGPQGGVDQP
jgi:hypothetical protein